MFKSVWLEQRKQKNYTQKITSTFIAQVLIEVSLNSMSALQRMLGFDWLLSIS